MKVTRGGEPEMVKFGPEPHDHVWRVGEEKDRIVAPISQGPIHVRPAEVDSSQMEALPAELDRDATVLKELVTEGRGISQGTVTDDSEVMVPTDNEATKGSRNGRKDLHHLVGHRLPGI